MTDQIEEVNDKIVKVLKKHGVKGSGLFGSLVRVISTMYWNASIRWGESP